VTEEERQKLYWSLLRGIAKEIQDKQCAEDKEDWHHDWSPVKATDYFPDLPFIPLSAKVMNSVKVYRSFTQVCLNCGKVKTWT
jgi:hypothetical protein